MRIPGAPWKRVIEPHHTARYLWRVGEYETRKPATKPYGVAGQHRGKIKVFPYRNDPAVRAHAVKIPGELHEPEANEGDLAVVSE
jgi:hypothetical protein